MKNIERDIAFMALINKAIEMNQVSINMVKDARYTEIGTLLYSIQQNLQDSIRERYVDVPIEEVDASKYKNATTKAKAKAKATAQAKTQNFNQNQSNAMISSDEDDEDDEDLL